MKESPKAMDKTDNELIDDFYAEQGGMRALKEDLSFYESDWNMLIPVVQKAIGFTILVNNSIAPWIKATHRLKKSLINVDQKDIYNGLISYIKWYNSQNNGQ